MGASRKVSAAARKKWTMDGSPGLFRAQLIEPGMGRAECAFEVADQTGKGTGERRHPCDENIVAARQSIKGKQLLGRGHEPATRPISRHRVSDLAAGGKADPNGAIGLPYCTTFQNEPRCRVADAACGPQKLLTLFQALDPWLSARSSETLVGRTRQAESRLRPWARRRDSTFRPPAVAIRERKPCRRLRTILLG